MFIKKLFTNVTFWYMGIAEFFTGSKRFRIRSVANPGCLIPDPDFLPISDPGSKNLNKREG
jgi:hypothetical protein